MTNNNNLETICGGNPRWQLPLKECRHNQDYDNVECDYYDNKICKMVGLGSTEVRLYNNTEEIGIECAAMFESTGEKYCPKKQVLGEDLLCVYASMQLDEEVGTNRCTYDLVKKFDDNLGDC